MYMYMYPGHATAVYLWWCMYTNTMYAFSTFDVEMGKWATAKSFDAVLGTFYLYI